MTVSAAADESHRLAEAIDGQIEAIIARAKRQGGVYLRLAEILPKGIGEEIREWREEQRILQGTDGTRQTGSNLAGMIRGLESQLMYLNDALSWALSSSGATWWLNQRITEIGISKYLVIPRGSYSSNFLIDTEGELKTAFRNLAFAGAAELDAETLDNLGTVRLLNVPKYDGLDAKWYPILTHELAHLVFDQTLITEWLSELETMQNTAARTAADYALQRRQNPQPSPWYDRLCAWLTEIACDSLMCFYYRAEGANALESISTVSGNQADTATHPSPRIRLTIQRSQDSACLDPYRATDTGSMDVNTWLNAFCELALPMRDHVMDIMRSKFPPESRRIQNVVYQEAMQALKPIGMRALSPSSQIWDRHAVKENPSIVESGLVRALWSTETTTDEGSYAAYGERAGLIARSLETLEFIHRFEQGRARLEAESNESPRWRDAVVNNLWITADGIYAYDPAASSEAENRHGQPAHDIRLGRYFIAFNRNEIATLSATNMVTGTDRVQREVEVSWDDAFVLHPGEMVLGVTLECLIMSTDCTAQVLSRSSVGRLGLLTATAVHIQPGYCGCPTLELVNLSSVPLSLVPGQRIAQVVPHVICGTTTAYRGHYDNIGWKPQFSRAEHDADTRILSAMGKG